MDESRWFTEQVHPHDAALKAYVRDRFPDEVDVEDIVQESYVRVWKARTAAAGTRIRTVKAFLFRVAQNVALDRIRRKRRRVDGEVGNLAPADVLDETTHVADRISAQEQESLLADALSTLPSRAYQVVILCKLRGMSHRDAARQLGIAEKTVDEHLRRGLKRLGVELRKRGVDRLYRP